MGAGAGCILQLLVLAPGVSLTALLLQQVIIIRQTTTHGHGLYFTN